MEVRQSEVFSHKSTTKCQRLGGEERRVNTFLNVKDKKTKPCGATLISKNTTDFYTLDLVDSNRLRFSRLRLKEFRWLNFGVKLVG